MASGDTLCVFYPTDNEPPTTNYATLDTRNQHPCLDFDATTAEAAIFSFIVPRNYGGGGMTVCMHYAPTSAVTGTAAFDTAFERIGDAQLDIDGDSFATAKTMTPVTVDGTSGNIDIVNIAHTNGAEIDSIAVGELARLRVRRDVADTAAGDLELYAVELKET